jgi:hypothetical protein
VEPFLATTTDSYERVTYDPGGNFRSAACRSLLERLGSQSWAVPADAHWPSASEKSIDILRVELDAVFAECPELSVKGDFAAATHRTNDLSTYAYNVTRRIVHLGRVPNAPRLRQHLFSQSPEWLPVSMTDIELFLSACDGKRQDHLAHTARVRLKAALSHRLTQPDPPVLENGDSFLRAQPLVRQIPVTEVQPWS